MKWIIRLWNRIRLRFSMSVDQRIKILSIPIKPEETKTFGMVTIHNGHVRKTVYVALVE